MPSTAQLLALIVASLILLAIPGPSVLFIVSRSVTLGRTAGLMTVVGNAAGEALQVIAVALGLGALMEQSLAVFTIVKLAGAAYLIYLGIQTVRHRGSLISSLAAVPRSATRRRVMLDGAFVGVTNPKSIVFFAAILPQFVNRASSDVSLQILVLGATFIATALLSDSTWALSAGTARLWLAREPKRLELMGGAGGLAMIGIGAALGLNGRKP